jgi:hypothetical protein
VQMAFTPMLLAIKHYFKMSSTGRLSTSYLNPV